MKNSFVMRSLQVIVFILLPTIMYAPPIPPNPGGTSPVTPIDGGVLFLFIAGISFGVFQIIQLKKKKVI
ncbi:MAG: hypothetical protein ACI9GM_000157 [Salibacteraceae bacterium]|jgi:hypothetical protein